MRAIWGGTTPEPGRRTFVALDGIRGVAVLAVMASHFDRFLPPTPILTPVIRVLDFGWFGVDLFFVLSGFLITGILVQTRAATNYFAVFYMRRILRIFPIYYAVLIAAFGVAAFVPAAAARLAPIREWWLYALYLENWIAVWLHAWPPNAIGHFWSLAVEEQFYLVWPVCVLAFSRDLLARVALGASLIALIIRCAWVALAGPDDGITYATFCRMDSLLVGALCALLYLRHAGGKPIRHLTAWCVAPLTAFVVLAIVTHGALAFVQSIGFSLLAIGFGALILGAAVHDREANPVQRVLRNPGLSRVGKYSYGMYVYHVPLLGACELLVFDRLPAALVAQPVFAIAYVCGLALLTFVVAAMSYRYVERPILGLKRHFEPLFASGEVDRAARDPSRFRLRRNPP
jgi:peptidoglycan/LPS O-acetylase OafA/YrhL